MYLSYLSFFEGTHVLYVDNVCSKYLYLRPISTALEVFTSHLSR